MYKCDSCGATYEEQTECCGGETGECEECGAEGKEEGGEEEETPEEEM